MLLDPSRITETLETWPAHEVAPAIQAGQLDQIPEDILADYPAVQQRVDSMRARWADRTVPWRRF